MFPLCPWCPVGTLISCTPCRALARCARVASVPGKISLTPRAGETHHTDDCGRTQPRAGGKARATQAGLRSCTYCVMLGKSFSFSVPQCPTLENWDCDSTCLLGWVKYCKCVCHAGKVQAMCKQRTNKW